MFPSMALSGSTALDDNSCSLAPPPPGAANLKGTFSPSSFPILSPFSSLSTHVVAAAPLRCTVFRTGSQFQTAEKKKNKRDGDRRREKSFSVLLCCCWLSLFSLPAHSPSPFPSSPPFFHFSPNSSNDHKSLLPLLLPSPHPSVRSLFSATGEMLDGKNPLSLLPGSLFFVKLWTSDQGLTFTASVSPVLFPRHPKQNLSFLFLHNVLKSDKSLTCISETAQNSSRGLGPPSALEL